MKNAVKHPKLFFKRLSKCMWSVFDTFRRPCNTKIGKIEAFIVRNKSIDLPCTKVEEPGELNMALKEQWGCMVNSEGPEILIKLDNLVLATGKVVDNALVNSGQFIRESLVQISDTGASPAKVVPVMICEGAYEVYDGATPIVILEDDHEIHKVCGICYCFEGPETQGGPKEGAGNPKLSFQTCAKVHKPAIGDRATQEKLNENYVPKRVKKDTSNNFLTMVCLWRISNTSKTLGV